MRVTMRWRAATRRARILPDFLVLGGARCGSSSLFAMLCAHEQVMAPSHKEVHFFDRNVWRGLDSYRRFFPLAIHRDRVSRRLGRPVVTGEATTYYLFHPAVPQRVASLLPDVKLVALLRDPVDRAHSQYHLAVRNGREQLSFEDALDAEPARLEGEAERLLADPTYRSEPHLAHSYLARGLYLEQLERWHAHVPREQLLVLRSEDLFADPGAVLDQVLRFLGLEPHAGELPPARNRAGYDTMRPETRERLRRFYAEPNRRLEEYLGRDLDWQRPAEGPADGPRSRPSLAVQPGPDGA